METITSGGEVIEENDNEHAEAPRFTANWSLYKSSEKSSTTQKILHKTG